MQKPDVSILMCTNKYDEYLCQAIDSCLSQTFSNFELVIVVNSHHNTIVNSIKDKYSDDRISLYCTNILHLTFSLNYGIHHCRAKYIARMDADDIAAVDRIEKQFLFMRENEDVCVCGSSYTYIDEKGRGTKTVRLPSGDAAIRRALLFRNPICHPTVMFKKNVILSIGGYSGRRYAQDYQMWCELMEKRSVVFANLSESLLYYRSFGNGARRSRLAYSSVSSVQWFMFVNQRSMIWFVSSILSLMKSILRSDK